MNLKKITILLVLVLAMVLITSSALAKKPVTELDEVTWELTKTEVVQEATLEEMPEGIFMEGYVLEAKAKAIGGNVVPEGYFRLELDAFSPYEDMGHQKADFWYVVGTWTVTNKDADPEELKVKHNPGLVEGNLLAELTFDPTTGVGGWTGEAVLPMSLAAGSWSSGEGSLTILQNQEGYLFLAFERWPELQ